VKNIEEIENDILCGKEFEEIVKEFSWKEFEEIVSEILEKNEFNVIKNFRFKTTKRYEIDLIGIKDDFLILIDCKHWSSGRNKTSMLKKSANKHEERNIEFNKFLEIKPEFKSRFCMKKRTKIFSLLVTWYEEFIKKENSTLIVPLWKLNNFLNNELYKLKPFKYINQDICSDVYGKKV